MVDLVELLILYVCLFEILGRLIAVDPFDVICMRPPLMKE